MACGGAPLGAPHPRSGTDRRVTVSAMRRRLAVLTLMLTACAGASGDIDRRITVSVDGIDRAFQLLVPAGTAAPAPLVIVFHGFTSNAEAVREASGFDDVARAHGFAVAYPQGLGVLPGWRATAGQGDEDLRFVEALIAAAADEFDLDEQAVFVAGFSNGGAMAVRVGCELPGLVAGVGAVAAAVAEPACLPHQPMPLLVFHGTGDRIVPYEGVPGVMAPVEGWVGRWAASAGCESAATRTVAADVAETTWTGCGAPLGLYTIDGGGHGWPGPTPDPWWGSTTDAIDASDLLARFFASIRG